MGYLRPCLITKQGTTKSSINAPPTWQSENKQPKGLILSHGTEDLILLSYGSPSSHTPESLTRSKLKCQEQSGVGMMGLVRVSDGDGEGQ